MSSQARKLVRKIKPIVGLFIDCMNTDPDTHLRQYLKKNPADNDFLRAISDQMKVALRYADQGRYVDSKTGKTKNLFAEYLKAIHELHNGKEGRLVHLFKQKAAHGIIIIQDMELKGTDVIYHPMVIKGPSILDFFKDNIDELIALHKDFIEFEKGLTSTIPVGPSCSSGSSILPIPSSSSAPKEILFAYTQTPGSTSCKSDELSTHTPHLLEDTSRHTLTIRS